MIKPFKKARAAHLKLGERGEDLACDLLRSRRIEILMRNYRCKQGEIDIIARDGSTICFVEVKTRSAASRARPAKGLRPKQQKRIIRASKHYLREMNNPKVVCRYDLVELRLTAYDVVEARYWPAHFTFPKRTTFLTTSL